MSSDIDELVNIIVCHGPKKNKVEILASAKLEELNEKIETLLSIKKDGQKLIYKGKLLINSESPISSFGIKDGDIIMALGKTVKHEIDALYLELGKIEDLLKEAEAKVKSIIKDIEYFGSDPIQCQRYLPQRQDCMKKLLLANEELMKLLETLDSLQMEVKSEEVRSRRKGIVTDIQKLMDQVDRDYSRFEAYLTGS